MSSGQAGCGNIEGTTDRQVLSDKKSTELKWVVAATIARI